MADRNDLVINLLRYLHAHGERATVGFENGEPVVVLPAPPRPLPPLTGPVPGARWTEVHADGTATLEIQL